MGRRKSHGKGRGRKEKKVVPQFVGQRYHDTTNSKCYEAFAVTGATSNWKLLN